MGAVTMIALIVKGKEASCASVSLILTITARMVMSGLNCADQQEGRGNFAGKGTHSMRENSAVFG